MSGVEVRGKREDDDIFRHQIEPVGEYVITAGHEVVGTGGFMLHYNPPFADLYMEIREDQRRRGFGSFLIQELKKECYRTGRVPAARCPMENSASKGTLIKAGLKVSGFMLFGSVERN
jgi:GNAT superfamily N-acetyltransferase